MSNTATKLVASELSGDYKVYVTQITAITTASETITLTLADNGIREIAAVLASPIVAGADANLATAHVSFSGLTLTLVTLNAAGSNATDWTGAKVNIVLLAR